jgi:hypothetical protein
VIDFGTDPEVPKKERHSNASLLIVEFLSLSKKFIRDAESGGGNPSYSAGKAVAYYNSAKKLANAIRPSALQYPIFGELEKRLVKLSHAHSNPVPEKIIRIEHKRDPDGVKVEERRLDIQQGLESPEVSEKKGLMSQVESALLGLGYKQREASIRAFSAIGKGGTLEEIIAEACR